MTTDLEKRKHERFVHREPVELSYQDLKKYHRAEMVNYGEGGMCIESIFPFRPGETVYIHAVQLPSKIPFFEPDDNLNAAVRFCRKLDDADSAFHRVGVQFLNPLPSPASRHNLAENGDLRRRAEKYLDKHSDAIQDEPVEDVSKMLHELQVHQTELEMQNEELRLAQAEIESSRNRYHFLYDFAPIGYFTFNPYGQILEANLTGADYLEVERALLINTDLGI